MNMPPMDIREKMRRDWDRRARIDPRYWVAATEEADEASYRESAARDAEALLEGLAGRVAPDARVLDLGCGIGRLAGELAGEFAEVVGVDVSEEMVAAARALHADRPNLRFEVNSGADLAAFEADSFDLVFSYSVLPHLPPDVVEAYFREVGRVLRPGGWFRYQFWVGPTAPAALDDTLSIRVYPEPEVERLSREAGLAVRETTRIEYFDPVLKLHPVWIDAQKVGAPLAPAAAPHPRAPGAAPGAERQLEYSLLLYLAVKHGERGEVGEAERVLESAVALEPERPEAYVQWAAHRLEADDAAGALRLFEELTTRAPGCAAGWLYRAQTAEALGKTAAAKAALRRLEMMRPDDPRIREDARALKRRLRGG